MRLSEIEIGGQVEPDHLDDLAKQHDFTPRQGVLFPDHPSEPDLPKDMKIVGRLGELYVTYKREGEADMYYLFASGKPVAYVAVQAPNTDFGGSYRGRNAHNPDIEGTGLRVVSIYLDPIIRGKGTAVALYYWLLSNKCDYILPDDLQTRGGVFIWRQLLSNKQFEVVVFNSAKHDYYWPRPGATWAQVYKGYNLYPFVTLRGKADQLISHELDRGAEDDDDDEINEGFDETAAAALHAERDAAMEAFAAERTRSNLERVWAAQKAIADYQEHHFPSKPTPEPVAPEHAYAGEHAAPDHENGAPLWNLTGIYPADFYTGRAYEYASEPLEKACIGTMVSLHNRPNAPIVIYRAVPAAMARVKINPGDWVTISRRYAVEHGRDNLRNQYRIISKTVFARDLFTDGNSAAEFGYDPQPRAPRRQRTPT